MYLELFEFRTFSDEVRFSGGRGSRDTTSWGVAGILKSGGLVRPGF